MSINRDSPTDKYMRERSKIQATNLLNNSSAGSSVRRCSICVEQYRLIPENGPDGKFLVCKQGCGKRYSMTNDVGSDNTTNKKYVTRYGNASGTPSTYIISQGKKRKKPGELDDETASDLALFGYSSSGARIVEQETHTYQNGAWS